MVATLPEYFCRHLRVALVIGRENFAVARQSSRLTSERLRVFTQVRMMDKGQAIGPQLCRELTEIGLDGLRADMDQRIEAEDEIDRARRNHRQAVALVQ